jgi:glycopeptide antibiotics resistance protein
MEIKSFLPLTIFLSYLKYRFFFKETFSRVTFSSGLVLLLSITNCLKRKWRLLVFHDCSDIIEYEMCESGKKNRNDCLYLNF